MATEGFVASRLIVTLAEFDKPAPFVAAQLYDWLGVSVLTVEDAHAAEVMPETLSLEAKLTFTSPVYHPSRPCGPLTVGVITGALLSRFTVIEVDAVRPASLVTVQLYDCSAV